MANEAWRGQVILLQLTPYPNPEGRHVQTHNIISLYTCAGREMLTVTCVYVCRQGDADRDLCVRVVAGRC